MSQIRVIHKLPALPAEVVLVENNLKGFRGLLNGGTLSFLQIDREHHLYCDDEGMSKELPENVAVGGTVIVGPIIISKQRGCDDCGFDSEEEALLFCARLNSGSV
jgi:hypothetical protein